MYQISPKLDRTSNFNDVEFLYPISKLLSISKPISYLEHLSYLNLTISYLNVSFSRYNLSIFCSYSSLRVLIRSFASLRDWATAYTIAFAISTSFAWRISWTARIRLISSPGDADLPIWKDRNTLLSILLGNFVWISQAMKSRAWAQGHPKIRARCPKLDQKYFPFWKFKRNYLHEKTNTLSCM